MKTTPFNAEELVDIGNNIIGIANAGVGEGFVDPDATRMVDHAREEWGRRGLEKVKTFACRYTWARIGLALIEYSKLAADNGHETIYEEKLPQDALTFCVSASVSSGRAGEGAVGGCVEPAPLITPK